MMSLVAGLQAGMGAHAVPLALNMSMVIVVRIITRMNTAPRKI